jgi:hypothetical protein
MQEEMDCMKNVMETGINWYSSPLQHMIIGGTIFAHKNMEVTGWNNNCEPN